MNTAQAKKDAAKRLAAAGISYDRMTAKAVGFSDLARGQAVFVTVHNPTALIAAAFADLPKASAGGYIVRAERPGCVC